MPCRGSIACLQHHAIMYRNAKHAYNIVQYTISLVYSSDSTKKFTIVLSKDAKQARKHSVQCKTEVITAKKLANVWPMHMLAHLQHLRT